MPFLVNCTKEIIELWCMWSIALRTSVWHRVYVAELSQVLTDFENPVRPLLYIHRAIALLFFVNSAL
jgi:hypothetical protein